MRRVLRGLTTNHARTDPRAADRRLRGRTYAIPFDAVWNAALALADGGLKRWRVVDADDEEGLIRAVSTTWLFRFPDDVQIVVGLDENGQTRVDLRSRSRKGRGDLGRNPRLIGHFLRALDQRLDARPEQILDAVTPPSWST